MPRVRQAAGLPRRGSSFDSTGLNGFQLPGFGGSATTKRRMRWFVPQARCSVFVPDVTGTIARNAPVRHTSVVAPFTVSGMLVQQASTAPITYVCSAAGRDCPSAG